MLFIAGANASREATLQQEPITVDLWWKKPSDYHNQLASYAYRICKTKAEKEWVKLWNKYSCENQILTWNAENWWRNKLAKNTANKNGTHDWWLCQLNSAYHKKFIKSEWFNNPLAQLEYCNEVWFDAHSKWTMPWYAYAVRHKRNKGITFTQSNADKVEVKQETIPKPQHNPWCRYMWTVWEWRRLQVDLHWVKWFINVLFDYVFGEWRKWIVFNCDN